MIVQIMYIIIIHIIILSDYNSNTSIGILIIIVATQKKYTSQDKKVLNSNRATPSHSPNSFNHLM